MLRAATQHLGSSEALTGQQHVGGACHHSQHQQVGAARHRIFLNESGEAELDPLETNWTNQVIRTSLQASKVLFSGWCFQLVVPSFPIKGFESLENKRFLKTKQSCELQVYCWCNAVKPPPEKVSVFPSNLARCFLPCGSNWCLTERNERRPNLEIGKTSLPSQQLL